MPNIFQKFTDGLYRVFLRTVRYVPVKNIQKLVYWAALDIYDFKTLDYLLDQENLPILDDDRSRTIAMVAAAHRWVSNGGPNISYQSDSEADWWTKHPIHAPRDQATFLMNMLKKAIKKPLNNPSEERLILISLQVVRAPHIHLDLSSNDVVLGQMKFSSKIIPFLIIKTLDSYANTSIRICERFTCDELLRRHFKKIDWMADLEPERKTLKEHQYAWKDIVEYVPEPYLLSLIRSHKDLVHNPCFIEKILKREFSFKVWSSVCEAGANVDVVQEKVAHARHTGNKNAMDKILEFCNYFAATQQKSVLTKIVGEVAEEEVAPPPRKRKM